LGRTLIPFNQLVHQIKQDDWGKFRRALPKEDRDRLDELFEMARHHAAPGSYASSTKPMEVIFMAMLLEILRRVGMLEERIPSLGEGLSESQGELEF